MKMYHVDAFTDRLFAGNSAAVCLMDRFPADAVMQNMVKTATVYAGLRLVERLIFAAMPPWLVALSS